MIIRKLLAFLSLWINRSKELKSDEVLLQRDNHHDEEEVLSPHRPKELAKVAEEKKEVLLWYPKAIKLESQMVTRGNYEYHYPVGAVVHFTAGRDKTEQDMINSMTWGVSQKFAFFGIGPTGKVYQAHPLNRWGSHAGSSFWNYLGKNVSTKLVGIEIACAGQLTNGKSWFGASYKTSETRFVTEEKYGCPTGEYKQFTREQETALIELLLWLKANCPEVFSLDYVLGHHEVSGKIGLGYFRKPDPGGALSMTMPELRALLKSRYTGPEFPPLKFV